MKAKITNIYLLILLLLILLLVSCSLPQNEEISDSASVTAVPLVTLHPKMTLMPSSTSTESPTSTPLPTATQTATRVSTDKTTATPTPILFSNLPPGNYLVYSACLSGHCRLDILSHAGEHQGTLSTDILLSGNISPDQPLLVFSDEQGLLRVLDLEADELVPLKASDDQCFDSEWSPDGQHIVTRCNKEVGAEIYVFSLQEGTSLRLTDCAESGDGCGNPTWSPDGKWIAYNRAPDRSGVSETRGLYLLNTACFAEPATCLDTDLGPFGLISPQTWSPDSLYLAGRHGGILIQFSCFLG